MDAGVSYALRKLAWLGQRRTWPNGLRWRRGAPTRLNPEELVVAVRASC